jgi:hypothetical protein
VVTIKSCADSAEHFLEARISRLGELNGFSFQQLGKNADVLHEGGIPREDRLEMTTFHSTDTGVD